MLPVEAAGVTDADKVTLCPVKDGFALEISVVVVAASTLTVTLLDPLL